METTTILRTEVNMSVNTLHQLIINTVKNGVEFAKSKDWVIKGETEIASVEGLLVGLQNASKNQRKRIGTAIYRVGKKPTLRSYNLFFHYIKKISGEAVNIRFEPSLAEQEAQSLRRQWLTARAESERLLKLYKDAKKVAYKK